MKKQSGGAARSALHAWLEIDLDAEPIQGRLRPEHGPEHEFEGWLGFAEALRRLHDAGDPMGGAPCGRS